MASEKARTILITGMLVLVAILVFGGLALLILKVRAQTAQNRALARLKEENPVEYYLRHTPLAQSEEELKNAMVGTWELTGAKSARTGGFVTLASPQNFHKTFTLETWAIVTCDDQSNVLYSAGGHYTLQGDRYTEAIESATGTMTRYLGAHPSFRIRVVGDEFYQMGAGEHPTIEERWQRAGP